MASSSAEKLDKLWRRHVTAVDRVLATFDTILQDWPDYIAFLARLLKVLESSPSDVHAIPSSSLLSKRLAQCLGFGLPAGVHQKTLEVYGVVFDILGRNELGQSLHLFLPGLASLLAYASTSVKPQLLSLYQKHILQLDRSALLPATRAIILGLLPGLEDSSNDEFEIIFDLLNSLRAILCQDPQANHPHGESLFWQALFLCNLRCPTRRAGVLAFLDREMPSISGNPDQSMAKMAQKDCQLATVDCAPHLVNPDPGLLIRCFVSGLKDEQILIQRGFMELLVTRLPLQCKLLQEDTKNDDLVLLVGAAISVTTKREMSLNRRLWVWLFGRSETSSTTIHETDSSSPDRGSINDVQRNKPSFFTRFTVHPLSQALLGMLRVDPEIEHEHSQFFRICTSLLQQDQRTAQVIPALFRPSISCLMKLVKMNPQRQDFFQSVMRSATEYFDALDARHLHKELHSLMDEAQLAITSKASSNEALDILGFITVHFQLRQDHMSSNQALSLLLHNVQASARCFSANDLDGDLSLSSIGGLMRFSMTLLNAVSSESIQNTSRSNDQEESRSTNRDLEIECNHENFISADIECLGMAVNASWCSVGGAVRDLISSTLRQPYNDELNEVSQTACNLLSIFVRRTSRNDVIRQDQLLLIVMQALSNFTDSKNHDHLLSLVMCQRYCSLLEDLYHVSDLDQWSASQIVDLIFTTLISQLWKYLAPVLPRHNIEAVKCLSRLHAISPKPHLFEDSFARYMVSEAEDGWHGIHIDAMQKITSLWSLCWSINDDSSARLRSTAEPIHSTEKRSTIPMFGVSCLVRPLFLILDEMISGRSEVAAPIKRWLESVNLIPILGTVWRSMLDTDVGTSVKDLALMTSQCIWIGPRAEEVYYYLSHLQNILKLRSPNLRKALRSQIPFDLKPKHDLSASGQYEHSPDMSVPLVNHILEASNDILQLPLASDLNQESRSHAVKLRNLVLGIVPRILEFSDSSSEILERIEQNLIQNLRHSVLNATNSDQADLIRCLILIIQRRLSENPDPKAQATGTGKLQESAVHSRDSAQALLDSFFLAIKSSNSSDQLDAWLHLLDQGFLAQQSNIYGQMLQIVGALCLKFDTLLAHWDEAFISRDPSCLLKSPSGQTDYLQTFHLILAALENLLSRAQNSDSQDVDNLTTKESLSPQSGILGSMVNISTTQAQSNPPTDSANNRLIMILAIKEVVKSAFQAWSWSYDRGRRFTSEKSAMASFNHYALRLRNRIRRILEYLFDAEPMECVETVIHQSKRLKLDPSVSTNLFNALESSRPKYVLPALFNAIYSRTNASALDVTKRSSMVSDLSESELTAFLETYVVSTDDDALEEMWQDCVTFSRDLLINPLVHRNVLPSLLRFVAAVAEKIDRTNFGDQRKMKKEIADIFIRFLAALFTVRPLSWSRSSAKDFAANEETIGVLKEVMPRVTDLLIGADRIASAAAAISTQVFQPVFRSKVFPEVVSSNFLALLEHMASISTISRIWKRDISEPFNDVRFFSPQSSPDMRRRWMHLVSQWSYQDKERLPELLSRISTPAVAGMVFGVGASSARLETDRKTQLNLRRITFLILSAAEDTFVDSFEPTLEKIIELTTASANSSPSSLTRAELFMLMRALLLKFSPVHLGPLWPILHDELFTALSSIIRLTDRDTYNITAILHAAKLLDTVLLISPDDFQVREWLYITDTAEAVNRSTNQAPQALADHLANNLSAQESYPAEGDVRSPDYDTKHTGLRHPLLRRSMTRMIPREHIMDQIIRPFLQHLSMQMYESAYHLETADLRACLDELRDDLFDEL